MAKIRKFKSNASRDTDEGKIQYARHLSPEALKAFCEYMHKHRKIDGGLREPDNWKKGFPKQSFMDSGFRHQMEVWRLHELRKTRGWLIIKEKEELKDALCGVWFNCMGFLHEELKDKF